jgi:hypothetical protein
MYERAYYNRTNENVKMQLFSEKKDNYRPYYSFAKENHPIENKFPRTTLTYGNNYWIYIKHVTNFKSIQFDFCFFTRVYYEGTFITVVALAFYTVTYGLLGFEHLTTCYA